MSDHDNRFDAKTPRIAADRRIVVTGMGVWTPCGKTIAEFSESIKNGESGIRSHDGIFDNRPIWAGLVAGYEPRDYFSDDECRKMDRTAQMGYIAAKQAIDDAGLVSAQLAERTGLTLGTSHGGRSQLDQFVLAGSPWSDPEWAHRLLVTAAHFQQTAYVATKLGLHGPTSTLSNACSSSGAAIAYGIEWLLSGKCDHVVAGGADGFSRLTYSGFSALGAMADGPCSPFSEQVGLSLGDGAGFLVLETLENAVRRNARIHAEIWAYGLSWDAYHITAPEPSGEGMNRAIRMAVERAGIAPSRIDYVNVHGTGTRSNDLAETVGLQRYFEGSPPPASATKSQTGHMLGASSAIGVITSILGRQGNWLPPTSNFTAPRSGCEIDVVPNQSRAKSWSCFMAQSAAFAGANAVIIGGELADDREPVSVAEDDIVISGVGVVSPIGCGFEKFIQALRANRSGLSVSSPEENFGPPGNLVGAIRDFQPRKLMPTLNLRRVDRVAAYATVAASLALQDAGRWPMGDRSDSTGLVVGLARGAATSYEKYLASVAGGNWEDASAVYFPNLVMSSVGGQVSASLGIRGITSSLVGSLSAGLQALIHGWELLRRNPTQQSVIVLASDELSSMYSGLVPTAGSRPSGNASSNQASVVLGEGSVAFVLERKRDVLSRGGKVRAILRGWGLTQNGDADLATDEGDRWFDQAVDIALRESRRSASDVQHLFCNGRFSNHLADSQKDSLKRRFGHERPIRSIQELIGLSEAASSLFQVAACLDTVSSPAEGKPNSAVPEHAVIVAGGEDGLNAAVVIEMVAE